MYLVFDTETTGLPANFQAPVTDSANWPRLVELAWGVYGNDGTLHGAGQLLVQPEGFIIPAEATRIHGITTEQAAAAGVNIGEALGQLVAAADKCQYVVAHNLEYDLAIIGAELHRLGRPGFGEGIQLACTMRMGTGIGKGPGGRGGKPPKLHELHEALFDEQLAGAHRAGADMAACARCLFALLGRGVAIQAPNGPVQPAVVRPRLALPALDLDNREFQLALDLIENTNRSVFLTGKAGTGKSTFLRHIVANTRKRAIVVAPTGVAALNAGGQTIHKLFGLPLGPVQRNNPRIPYFGPQRFNPQKFINKERYELLQAVEVVIIDEVSMVRADILDAIDRSLRINSRRLREPFGGKQVLLVGDAYQLPPVLPSTDKELFARFQYATPYFFSARVFADFPLITVELRKAYRQQDPGFVQLLDRVRTNQANGSDLARLNSQTVDSPKVAGRSIVLSTHNQQAEDYNAEELKKLSTRLMKFEGTVTGDFAKSDNDYPTGSRDIVLKEGAQVMFVRNDRSNRWVNGTVGRVVKLEKRLATVEIEQGLPYAVEAETWDKISYKFDDESSRIASTVVGTFTQLPLKLAWALTVHKSQGLTFDAVEINAPSGFFGDGQLYVALSRCRSFEGLRLRTPVRSSDVKVSREVLKLHRTANDEQQVAAALEEARPNKSYRQSMQLLDRGDVAGAVRAFCEALSLRNDVTKPLFERLLRYKLYGRLQAKAKLADLSASHEELQRASQLELSRQAEELKQARGMLIALNNGLRDVNHQRNESQRQNRELLENSRQQAQQWQLERQRLEQQLAVTSRSSEAEQQKYKKLEVVGFKRTPS